MNAFDLAAHGSDELSAAKYFSADLLEFRALIETSGLEPTLFDYRTPQFRARP